MSLTQRIARLNADGTPDTTFVPGSGLNGPGLSLAVLADGRILAGGSFTQAAGSPRNNLALFKPDGTLDGTVLDANAPVRLLLRQADGKVIVGGDFATLAGAVRPGLARLQASTALEAAFEPDLSGGTLPGSLSGTPHAGVLQADGKVLVGGDFTAVSEVARDRLARLHNTAAVSGLSVQNSTTVNWVRGGALEETDRVTFEQRLLTGSTWGPWTPVSGTVERQPDRTGWRITSISPAMSGKGELRARAYPGQGRNMGVLETVAVFDFKPEISVLAEKEPDSNQQQPVEVQHGNAANPLAFADTQAGSTRDIEFTIVNSGLLPLALTDQDGSSGVKYAVLGGPQASQFQLISQPSMGTLQPGETTSFRLRFKPTVDGPMLADVTILSNDSDEATFKVHVSGEAYPGPGARDEQWQPSAGYTTKALVDSAVPAFVNALAVRDVEAQEPAMVLTAGGGFESFRSNVRNRLVQLDKDGSLLLHNGSAVTGSGEPVVNCVACLEEGRLLVGGTFQKFNGTGTRGLAYLNADGSLQPATSFRLGYSGASIVSVRALAPQPDGRILVGGEFTFKTGGKTYSNLVRFYKGGELDTTFAPNPNKVVHTLVVQEDGSILVGGAFSTIGSASCNALARLTSRGGFDSGFSAGLPANSQVQAMAMQAVTMETGEAETTMELVTRLVVYELNSGVHRRKLDTGAVEGSVTPVTGRLYSLVGQADGRMFFAGTSSLIRYAADGTVDETFNTAIMGPVRGVNGHALGIGGVYSLAIQADGNVLAGGYFSIGNKNYQLVRLENDREDAGDSLSVPDYSRIQWLRGGKLPEVSAVAFFLQEPGGAWKLLKTGENTHSRRIPGGWELTGLQLPAQGRIMARARIPSGRGNGSSGLLEKVSTFSNTGVPDLEILGPNGGSVVNNGTLVLNNIEAGREGEVVLMLSNTGTPVPGQPEAGQISGLTFTTRGMVTLQNSESTLIAAGSSQKITLRYRPAAGNSSGSLVIGSNVPGNKKSFTISFTAFGVSEPVIDLKSVKHSAITHNSVRLQAKVTPNDVLNVDAASDSRTQAWFEWQVKDSNTVHRVPEEGFPLAGSNPLTVVYDLGGLTPQTQYVYRFVVRNSLYTRRILADINFKTAVPPVIP